HSRAAIPPHRKLRHFDARSPRNDVCWRRRTGVLLRACQPGRSTGMSINQQAERSVPNGPRLRAAIDVGGTFTDVFILDEGGNQTVAKVPSTSNPIDAVMNGAEAANIDWHDVELFTHGTTIATNALITRNFQPAARVTTKGFRGVLEIGRGTREDPWDAYKEGTPPYVRRRDRFVVTERINYRGEI